jgi:hypothetical protein
LDLTKADYCSTSLPLQPSPGAEKAHAKRPVAHVSCASGLPPLQEPHPLASVASPWPCSRTTSLFPSVAGNAPPNPGVYGSHRGLASEVRPLSTIRPALDATDRLQHVDLFTSFGSECGSLRSRYSTSLLHVPPPVRSVSLVWSLIGPVRSCTSVCDCRVFTTNAIGLADCM